MKQIISLLSCVGFLLAAETTATYKVEGMMCGVSCPKAIQKSLNGVDGVKICIVDFKSRTTTVTYDAEKIDSENIKYLNRLSDALFVWSRWVSRVLGDEENLWKP